MCDRAVFPVWHCHREMRGLADGQTDVPCSPATPGGEIRGLCPGGRVAAGRTPRGAVSPGAPSKELPVGPVIRGAGLQETAPTPALSTGRPGLCAGGI